MTLRRSISLTSMAALGAALVLALSGSGPHGAEAQACNRNCPGGARDSRGCCVAGSPAGGESGRGRTACAAGEHRSGGHCCGAGEEWVPAQRACVCLDASGCSRSVAAPGGDQEAAVDFVDYERLFSECSDGRVGRLELRRDFEQRQADLDRRQNELRARRSALEAMRPGPERDRMTAEYERSLVELQRIYTEAQRVLVERENRITARVVERVRSVVRAMQADNPRVVLCEEHCATWRGNDLTLSAIQRYEQTFAGNPVSLE